MSQIYGQSTVSIGMMVVSLRSPVLTVLCPNVFTSCLGEDRNG